MSLIKLEESVKREYTKTLGKTLDKMQTQALSFNEYWANAFTIMYNDPQEYNINLYKDGEEVKIAPTTQEMLRIIEQNKQRLNEITAETDIERVSIERNNFLRSIIKPVMTFNYIPPVTPVTYKSNGEEITKETRVWINKSTKDVNFRPGFANGDSATPGKITLGDDVVHAMGGGRTGAGKSVMLNTIEASLLLEYPPWELGVYLCDFKIVEASRFGSPIRTPHIDAIAATGSSEYTRSLFDFLAKELNDRSTLCTYFGVQKLADLRKELGMVVPRIVLIVDEFTQLFENIKSSAEQGNDHADEDKQGVNSSISALARLGRSFGMHMFLTSQQLDDLDDGIAKQFKAGIALPVAGAISKSLIGNEASGTLKGKGKAYFNADKGLGREDENILMRIPYISSESSDPTKPTDLAKIIILMNKLAAEIEGVDKDGNPIKGFKKINNYYNEDNEIPIAKLAPDLEWCKKEYEGIKNNPNQRDPDKLELGPIVALGKPLAFDPESDLSYIYRMVLKKNEGLLLDSSDKKLLYYIIDILLRNFEQYNIDHVIINCDPRLYGESRLCRLVPAPREYKRPMLPDDVLASSQLRSSLIQVQMLFDDKTTDGKWSSEVYYEEYRLSKKKLLNTSIPFSEIIKILDAVVDGSEIVPLFDSMQEGKDKSYINDLKEVFEELNDAFNFKKTFIYNQELHGGHIDACKFKQKIIWFLGLEAFDYSDDYEGKRAFKMFLENAPSVGLFPILTANFWTTCGVLVEKVENIIDGKSNKDFFTSVSLVKNININKNSFQYHNRSKKVHQVIQTFS